MFFPPVFKYQIAFQNQSEDYMAKMTLLTWLSSLYFSLWVSSILYHLTVCYYYVTYAFQGESTLYSCLNVKELFARNRRHIWNLSDSNGIRTYDHLLRVHRTSSQKILWNCFFPSLKIFILKNTKIPFGKHERIITTKII